MEMAVGIVGVVSIRVASWSCAAGVVFNGQLARKGYGLEGMYWKSGMKLGLVYGN